MCRHDYHLCPHDLEKHDTGHGQRVAGALPPGAACCLANHVAVATVSLCSLLLCHVCSIQTCLLSCLPAPTPPALPGGGGAKRQHGARVLPRRHPLPLPAQAAGADGRHQCVAASAASALPGWTLSRQLLTMVPASFLPCLHLGLAALSPAPPCPLLQLCSTRMGARSQSCTASSRCTSGPTTAAAWTSSQRCGGRVAPLR